MISCNHDFNDVNSTLKILRKREMVFPQIFYFQCNNCKKIFKGQKNKKGEFEEIGFNSF